MAIAWMRGFGSLLVGAWLAACTSSSTGPGDAAPSMHCSVNAQCASPQTCVAGATPGGITPFGCGAQPSDMCKGDADCADAGAAGASLVCVRGGGCEGARCAPGCSADGDCQVAQACQSRHCVVKPCGTDTDCPANYSCQAHTCAIKPCAGDADCRGFCVNGVCGGAPGGCTTEEGVP